MELANTLSGNSDIPHAWRGARRVLVVRLDNLGDVLLMTPAIHALRRSLPAVEITLLASAVGAQAGLLNPDIDDVIVYESPLVDPWQRLPHDSRREKNMILLLKECCFDGAIIFTSFRQSALPTAYLCYLADVPLRAAASVDGCGSLLTTRYRPALPMRHEVEHALDLVGALGLRTDELDMVLQIPEDARMKMECLRARLAYDHPLIIVHPGCSMPARTYPWELYAAAVDQLIMRIGATVIFTGTDDERELVERIRARMLPACAAQTTSLTGELSFGELCALVSVADLTITNNTGPMHVSAVVKTPVVALFALTNPPQQWHPWRVRHRLLYQKVPCQLCYSRVCPRGHECLRGVEPTQVVDAAVELLGELPVRKEDQGLR